MAFRGAQHAGHRCHGLAYTGMQRDRLRPPQFLPARRSWRPRLPLRAVWLRLMWLVLALTGTACGAPRAIIGTPLLPRQPTAASAAATTATPTASSAPGRLDWRQQAQRHGDALASPSSKAKHIAVASSKPALPQACRAVATDTHAGLYEPRGLHRGDLFERGEVILTFDDGPYPDKTPAVLDMLAQHDFSATFFVLGRHITRRSYALLQRMEREGHIIGSHSYDHDIEMAKHGSSQQAIGYIVAQHTVTNMLVQLALLAESPDDFDTLSRRVLDADPARRLSQAAMVNHLENMSARFRSLLAERGYDGGRYRVLYSRPPGGGPYLGRSQRNRQRYDAALATLGMLNVMWHAQSGDVDATRARQPGFLVNNISRGARRGGVLLLHDFIHPGAPSTALAELARQEISVIALDDAITQKYRCSTQQLGSLPL